MLDQTSRFFFTTRFAAVLFSKDSIGYNWLAGITLLLETSVDISPQKNYLTKNNAA
jgi:hypothetical protein